MTLMQILKLLDAAGMAFTAATQLAREVREGLSEDDQMALDARLARLQTQNDSDFARLEAVLSDAGKPT